MSLYVRTSKEMCDKSIQYNFIHRDKRRIQEFTDSKSFVTNLNVFFCDFRMVLFLISLQMFELIKFCYELNFFLLVFGEFLFMISIQMCELIMNSNSKVLYLISMHVCQLIQFCSVPSILFRISIQMRKLIVLFRIEKLCSGLKSFVPV